MAPRTNRFDWAMILGLGVLATGCAIPASSPSPTDAGDVATDSDDAFDSPSSAQLSSVIARGSTPARATIETTHREVQAEVRPQTNVAVSQGAEQLRIAAQNASERLVSSGNPSSEFLHVSHVIGTKVVLSTSPDAATWSMGRPSLLSRQELYITQMRVRASALPREISQWRGQLVSMFNAQGAVCTARITEPTLVSQVIPHFGTEQRWNGEDGSPKASTATVAREAFEMGHMMLVADIEVVSGDCSSAVWARDAALAAPHVVTIGEASVTDRESVLAAVRASTEYQSVQADYEADPEHVAHQPWDKSDTGVTGVSTMQLPNGEVYAWVSMEAGVGCGSFHGLIQHVYRREQTTHGVNWTRVDDALGMPSTSPNGAADLNGDGTLEWITTPSDITPAFLDCGC